MPSLWGNRSEEFCSPCFEKILFFSCYIIQYIELFFFVLIFYRFRDSLPWMGSDTAEAVDVLYVPSSYKVHRTTCGELAKLVKRSLSLLPEIEAARPRCSSGIGALCSLNEAIEKAKLLLLHCSEASKLYLVFTANTIMSRCEKSRKLLEQSLVQIQGNVPVLLAIEISRLVDDIRSATFLLDLPDEEAGRFVRQLFQHGASESRMVENFELKAFQSALLKLNINSLKTILIERRSIGNLLRKIGDSDPKKKTILSYFLYLFKKYADQIVADKAETINSEGDEQVSNGISRYNPLPGKPARVEKRISPSNSLSDSMLQEGFKCPLSSRIMYDPVVIASGQTYERVWIQKWFDEGNDTCPKTKMKLSNLSVTPNAAIKDLISRWCTKYGISISDPSAELEIGAVSTPDHSVTSIASLGSSISDLHFQVDLSNLSWGSLDMSFGSHASLPKTTNGLSRLSMPSNENSRRKSLESILSMSEIPWKSQCDLVEDFRCIVESDSQAFHLAPLEDFVSPILRFLGEAIHQGDVKAQRTGSQLLLIYLKKSRNGAQPMPEELYFMLASLLDSSDELKGESLDIIEMLSSQPSCTPNIVASGALSLIYDVLNSQSRALQGSVLRILRNLTADHDIQPHVFSLDNIIPKLVTFLDDKVVSLYVLYILQNLCDIEAAKIVITETSGCIASIAEMLNSESNDEKDIALSIFLTLCSQRLEYCELVMDEGVIPALVLISINGSQKSKGSALELLRLLRDVNCNESTHDRCSNPSPDQQKDQGEGPGENGKLSSSRPRRFLGIFSRQKR
ncbi:hypothetical protein SAY87_005736 [Trapa incisa]|uniref:RING-type E3 ubiquitin transferase n=1 Tax=Trapa incisa TaxID=236973 RepID=A0AAN7K3B9_9MYRT|nr:hypothetical protein SAY87_005736 [Trapa incisa]